MPRNHASARLARPSLLALAALLAGLSGSLLSGCRKGSAEASPASSSSPLVSPSPSAPSPEAKAKGNRQLALSPPGGSAPVDRLIEQQKKQVELLPGKVDNWISLGRAWVRKARESADPGFYLNARACADEALSIEPGNRLALGLESLVLLNEHRFAEAKDRSEEALARDPEDLTALTTLSDALLELGRFDEAAKAAQKAMDLKPNLPSYTRASYLRWLAGDTEKAKEAAKAAIDAGRDPRDPEPQAWVTVQAAMIFWHEGDYRGADAGFDRALSLFADYPPALVGKGRVALAAGNGKQAADHLAKAYALSPLVETAWLLGDARQMAGDEAGAKAAYELVLSRGKTSDPRTLALFLATKNRDHDLAVQLAKKERETRGDIYTEDALAWALYRAGKLDEARAASDKATRLGTKDATLLFHAGAIRIAQGDKAGGEKLVRQALKLSPRFDVTGAEEAAKLVGAAPAASGK